MHAELVSLAAQEDADASIAVAALMEVKDSLNIVFELRILIDGPSYLHLVVKGAAFQAREFQQPCQRIVLP